MATDIDYTNLGAKIKNAFDRNVDYTKNLDIFDESRTDSRNMMLTNKIATIPYALVDYSFPRGTIRVKMTDEIKGGFTHFVGPNFGFYVKRNVSGQAHIYRITDLKTIGQDVMELGFELDGVKDFCQQYQEYGFSGYLSQNEYTARVIKSTDRELWDRTLTTGDEPTDGTTFYKLGGFELANREKYFLVTGKISGHLCATYALSDVELLYFYNVLLSSDESEKLASQIYRIEAIEIANFALDDTEYEELSIEGHTIAHDAMRIKPYGNQDYVIRYKLAEGKAEVDVYENGGEFAAEAQLYVEGFGIVPFDNMLKYRLQQAYLDDRYVDFVVYENIMTGETMLEIDGVRLLRMSQNPTMPILSNAAPLAIRQFMTNQLNNTVTNAYSGALNTLAIGIASPSLGIAAAAGNIIGASTSTLTAALNMKNQLKGIGPTVSEGANGYIFDGIFYEYYAPNYSLEDGWTTGVAAFYYRNGYPCDNYGFTFEFSNNHKYWCLLLGKIKGSKEWSHTCINDIESGYIVYNYEDGYEVV